MIKKPFRVIPNYTLMRTYWWIHLQHPTYWTCNAVKNNNFISSYTFCCFRLIIICEIQTNSHAVFLNVIFPQFYMSDSTSESSTWRPILHDYIFFYLVEAINVCWTVSELIQNVYPFPNFANNKTKYKY